MREQKHSHDRMSGTVKWFRRRDGFGFITAEDGQDYYVHYSSIADPDIRVLERGQKVTFDVQETNRDYV